MGRLTVSTRRFIAASIFASGGLLSAQELLVDREVSERAQASQSSNALLQQGDVAYRDGDFKTSVAKYGEALGRLPRQASETRDLRASVVERFSQAAVQQARVLSRTGDYAAANDLLDQVDEEDVDPGNPEAAEMRSKIDDPAQTNLALTKEHSANIDRVRGLHGPRAVRSGPNDF